tara:strand:- start:1581 stop:1874 length:294 start_codon:yes stop_codon:yes gene_type:complete
MRITFKETDDSTKIKIFLNDIHMGAVLLDVWTHKWHIEPNFNIPYRFDGKREQHDSSYKAGKELVKLYNFLYPPTGIGDQQEFGISLEEILSFLKTK